jgi:hypothetical protein
MYEYFTTFIRKSRLLLGTNFQTPRNKEE